MNGIEHCKAMIFAAGMGTRLKPYTDYTPKALVKIKGKSLLERNIDYLRSFGIKEFVINTFHFSGQIHLFLSRYRDSDIKVHVSYEENGPFETGGGLAHASSLLKGDDRPFVVMNADILTDLNLGNMYDYHISKDPLATLAVTTRSSTRNFLFNDKMHLSGWKNNKTEEVKIVPSFSTLENLMPFAFSGVHLIHPRIFDLMPSVGSFSITDTYLSLAAQQTIIGYNHTGDLVLDVGKPDAIAKAEELFN